MTLLQPAAAVSPIANNFFLARQPILNRQQRLVAYELLFRTAAGRNDACFTDHTEATATVIAHASELGMGRVVGDQMAYVNVDTVGLMSDFINFLPTDKVTLEILESVKATPEVLEWVQGLKQGGFQFARDDVVAESDDVRTLQQL